MFETEKDVLEWYERQPGSITEEFVDSIPWQEVKSHQLNAAFIPVLFCMRDIEYFTDMYYKELLRTPTGKDPVIRRFMDRWSVEELQHGDLLNRFLNESGIPTSEKWQDEARAKIRSRYNVYAYLLYLAVKPLGRYFQGTHMAWGAINEYTALQGYRSLSQLSGHPVLQQLLTGIMREESLHATFYWNIARLKLSQARLSRDVARFSFGKFWAPVGQGPKLEQETSYVMNTLFRGQPGLELFDRTVAGRIERLPGFAGFKTLRDRVAAIVEAGARGNAGILPAGLAECD